MFLDNHREDLKEATLDEMMDSMKSLIPKKKCKKCCIPGNPISVFVGEGNAYYLCHWCTEIIKNLATGSFWQFMEDDGHELVKSPVSKNMLMARLKRAGKLKNPVFT